MDLQDFVFSEGSAGVVCGKLGVSEWVDGDGGRMGRRRGFK